MRACAIGLVVVLAVACSPATISRIGPPLPPRPEGCIVDILEKGETPSRPYRDVGLVALENCQDYAFPPCRTWLEKAVCELGGQVVYEPEEGHEINEFGPVTYRLLVAAYVADLRPDPDDPLLKSRTCSPPCSQSERCVDAKCIPTADCDKPKPPTAPTGPAEEGPTKCMD